VTAGAVQNESSGRHPVEQARIVSLVPSLTELLCDLGLAPNLVGRTGFCVHPREVIRQIPKVGGTKSVKLDRVRELRPTHVIVNVEENTREAVDELARFVPHVVVTFPVAPLDNLPLYRMLGKLFQREAEAEVLCAEFQARHDRVLAAAREWPRERVLYLIWKSPWMAVGRDTYVSRILSLVGWDTIPESSSPRYPEVTLTDAFLAGVDRVLLSSEPYRFRSGDALELSAQLRGKIPVTLIDGEMTSWYGSRAIAAMDYLREFRRKLIGPSSFHPGAF
jgi:ABC-type Fe3+-hydroxamate transport system substrate-binding protein